MLKNEVAIRKPTVADVPQIYDLVMQFADKGVMLPRSLSDLYDVIRSLCIACPADRPDRVVGVCGLHVCWADLGEIRSLSVHPDYQGSDLGRKLVDACLRDARELGLNRVFVLTYIPGYFEKLGFRLVDKNSLPHKIWADCLKCVKFPECGEIALELAL